jgi:hypothetical protein
VLKSTFFTNKTSSEKDKEINGRRIEELLLKRVLACKLYKKLYRKR